MAIPTIQPIWLDKVQTSCSEDAYCQKLLSALVVSPNLVPHFKLQHDILWYKNRFWIGNNVPLQQQIISALHDSAIGGYSRFPVTYQKLKHLFAWQGMKAATHSFVQSCVTCQQAKPLRSKYPGLLSPLHVPDGAWRVVTMDFIEGLPRSRTANCILVVVDKFFKYSHVIPLLHPLSTATFSQAFLDNVYKLHGMSTAIVSDIESIY
jgi:hypothetical protein